MTVRHRLHRAAPIASEPSPGPRKRARTEFATELEEGPPLLMRVSGSIDSSTAATLADRLDIASRGGVHPLIVDLAGVDVLASAGVTVIFAQRDRHVVHGTALTLLAAPDSVTEQALTLVGLAHEPPAR